jgi:3-phosphoshikimate 1-carboxyvinyltransferase
MTRVVEPMCTRDHTELALEAFGAQVGRAGTSVAIRGGQRLIGGTFHVPGDISSAAFWIVAAAALPGSDVTIEHVGLNPTRTGILNVLRRMGAEVKTVTEHAQAGEPIGIIRSAMQTCRRPRSLRKKFPV